MAGTTFPHVDQGLVALVGAEAERVYLEATADWTNPVVEVPDFREYEFARLNKYGAVVALAAIGDRHHIAIADELVDVILSSERAALQGAAGSGDPSQITRVFLEGFRTPRVFALRSPHWENLDEEDGIRIRHQFATRGGVG